MIRQGRKIRDWFSERLEKGQKIGAERKVSKSLENDFSHSRTIFGTFCPARKLSKVIWSLFDDFWRFLTGPFPPAPFAIRHCSLLTPWTLGRAPQFPGTLLSLPDDPDKKWALTFLVGPGHPGKISATSRSRSLSSLAFEGRINFSTPGRPLPIGWSPEPKVKLCSLLLPHTRATRDAQSAWRAPCKDKSQAAEGSYGAFPFLWAAGIRHLMWQILCNLEPQIWLEIITSCDAIWKAPWRHVMWWFWHFGGHS